MSKAQKETSRVFWPVEWSSPALKSFRAYSDKINHWPKILNHSSSSFIKFDAEFESDQKLVLCKLTYLLVITRGCQLDLHIINIR